MKRRLLSALLLMGWLSAFLPIPLANALVLTDREDRLSRQAASVAADHLVRFVSTSALQTPGQTIQITFPGLFNLSSLTLSDLRLTFGPTTGSETVAILAASAAINTWGVTFAGNVISLEVPTDAGVSGVAAADKVILRIGLNAGGTNQIVNPSVPNLYRILINTGSDSGDLFVPIVSADTLTVTATVPASTPPSTQPSGGSNGGSSTGGSGSPSDTREPLRIESVAITGITTQSAVITWVTTLPADATVEYGQTLAYGGVRFGAANVTNHQVELTGLQADSNYYLVIRSQGAGQTVSEMRSLRTLRAGQAPVISNVRGSSVSDARIDLTFQTGIGARSTVTLRPSGVGTPAGEQQMQTETGFGLNHALSFTGLRAGTSYDLFVTVQSVEGISSSAAPVTVRTAEDQTSPANPYNVNAVGGSYRISLAWDRVLRTGEYIQIVARTDRVALTPVDGRLVYMGTGRSVVDTDLPANTSYFYTLFARDARGNTSSGAVTNARTLADTLPTPGPTPVAPPQEAGSPTNSSSPSTGQSPTSPATSENGSVNTGATTPGGTNDASTPSGTDGTNGATAQSTTPSTGSGDPTQTTNGTPSTSPGTTPSTSDPETTTEGATGAGTTPGTTGGTGSGASSSGEDTGMGTSGEEGSNSTGSGLAPGSEVLGGIVLPPLISAEGSDGAAGPALQGNTENRGELPVPEARAQVYVANGALQLLVQENIHTTLVGRSLRIRIPVLGLSRVPVAGQLRVNGTIYLLTEQDGGLEATIMAPETPGDLRYNVQFAYADETRTYETGVIRVRPLAFVREGRLMQRDKAPTVADAQVEVLLPSGIRWAAESLQQANPVRTSATGAYGFVLANGRYRLRVQKEGFRTWEQNVLVTDQVLAVPVFLIKELIPLTELFRPGATVAENIQVVVGEAGIAAQIIREVSQTPEVQTVTRTVVAPAAVVASVGATATAVSSASALNYVRFLFTQPFLLIRRRRRKKWGTVYNAFSKKPIDLAIVRLLQATSGVVVQTRITDAQGRFSFQVLPGSYRLQFLKAGFTYPSIALKGAREDGDLLDLYHGEIIAAKEGVLLTPNIPVDPAVREETPARILWHAKLRRLQSLMSVVGMFMSFGALVIAPSLLMAGFVVLQLVLYVLFRRLAIPPRPTDWGIAYDETTKKPLSKTVVRIFDKKFNKLLETQVTDVKGKYGFFTARGLYYVTAEKDGYDKYVSSDIDLRNAKETIIDQRIGLLAKKVLK